MTDFTAYLRIGVDSRDALQAQKDLDKMAVAGDKSEKSLNKLSGASKLLGSAIGGIGLSAATAKVIDYADAWTDVENVLKGVSDTSAQYATTQAKILTLSKDTFSSLEGTATLYAEITRSVSELGINQERVIGVTKTINNLFLAGGKAASETAGAIRQLNQGLASGALRGDEFNSVAEGAPRILDALSQKLRVGKGDLREFAATGGITAELLIDALEEYSTQAQKAVDTTLRTFSQSAELARTFALEFVGASDGIKEFSATAGTALVTVAQNLDLVSDAVTVLAVAYGGRLAGSLATAAAAKASSIAAARALAIAENDAAVGIARRATVEAAAAKATLDKARADSIAATATLNTARANGTATASVAPLIAALNAQAIAQQKLTSSIAGSAAATSASNAANARLAATGAAVAGTNLLATSMRGLSGALALVGGPAGVAILAAGALVYFATRASEAEKILEGLNPELDGLTERFEALGFYQQQLARSELAGNIEDQKNKISALVEQLDNLRAATERDSQGFFSSYQRDLMVEVAAKIEAAEKSLAGMQSQLTSIKPPTDQIQGFVDSIASLNNVLGFFVSGDGVSKQFSLFAEGAGKVKSFSEEYQKLSADIEQQIALFGDESKASELAYLARTGQLKDISAQEAALLVERYKTLEQMEDQAAKAKEIAATEKDKAADAEAAKKSIEDTVTALEDELYALQNGEVAYLAYDLARKGASEAQIEAAVAAKKAAIDLRAENKKLIDDKSDFDDLIQSVDEFGGAWSRTGSIVADALGGIGDALNDYSAQMASISAKEAKLAEARKKYAGDTKEIEKISKAEKKLAEERTSANLKSFSTITSAFGQMFDEQSKERQAINNAEKVFTAIEIGLALQKASANALTAITASFAAPFPVNFAAGAAMIAIMAGLGVFGGGGGSSGAPTAADIQEAQGTGTVLGSSDKSESIAESADRYIEIGLDSLSELRGIRDALTGLSSGIALLARDFISGGNFSGAEVKGLGTTQALSVGDFVGKDVYDFLNPFGADILNRALGDLFGKTTKKLKDSGLKFDDQELGDILAGNFEAYFYNTVETTKKKLFGLSKKTSTKDELTGVDSAFEDQIAGIFGFIGSAVGGSLDALGIESAGAIENFKISIGKVSFKDLSGEEIQSELEAIFSQQADLLAEYAAPALKEYQQIGEGLFETLARVAKEFVTFNSYVDALGLNFNTTGLEAIAAQQAIAGFSGGMEALSENLSSYYENFFTEEERAANQMKLLTAEMNTLGYDAVPTSREAFRALVEGIDLTTEAGQKQFAGLVALNEVFAELVPETEALASASRSAADIAAERLSLEEKLWLMTATVADVREKELAALDGTNKSILEQIYALQDLQAAEKEAAAARVAVTNQLASLEKQYFDLTATEAEKRNALLQSLLSDEARAIQENIYAWNDAQDAAAEANKALEDAANAMDALKSAASSALDVLLSSVDAERARIELIVSNASSAKSALDSAIDAERSAIDKANQDKIAQLQSLADAERNIDKANADAQNEAQKALSKARIDSINQEKSATEERIGGLKSLFEQLTSAADDVTPKTNASILAARRSAIFEIDTALRNAASGRGLPTDGRLDTALQSVRENPSELYANAREQAFANDVVRNKLDELAGYTERQLTSEEQTLSILEQQLAAAQVSSDSFVEYAAASTNKYDDMIAAANAQYANDVAGLDLISKNAQAQIDKLTGIDSRQLSVEEALTAFNESLLAADFENAQEQYARLDGILEQGQLQLDTLLDIDSGVLSLRDAIDRFAAAVGAVDQTKVNEELLAEMKRNADEMTVMREDQRKYAFAQIKELQDINLYARETAINSEPVES